MSRVRPLPIVLLLALLGCASQPLETEGVGLPTLEPGAGHLRTQGDSFELNREGVGWGTEIELEFVNPLDEAIYVVNCNAILGLSLQRWESGEWRTFWTPVTPLCLSPPITIGAGESFRTSYRIWGAEPGRNTEPSFRHTNLDGTYRLVWHRLVRNYDHGRQGFGDPVPEEIRVSNSFELRRAQ